MAADYILAIDQGTTSTRVVLYDRQAKIIGSASKEFTQHFPQPGWVEHDADEIWQTVVELIPQLLTQTKTEARQIAAIGVTNQRETAVLWDKADGKVVGRAIVWQDRRTADFCTENKKDESWLYQQTGLVLDPYFSGTKVRWLLDNIPDARTRAEAGKLAFGTIDSILIYRLTGGKLHATDVTNASRTLFLNLHSAAWDAELCKFFKVPQAILPEVRPSSGDFGETSGLGFLPDGIPITGVAGDQQASLFGQCCYESGESKCTYGTGAFLLLHTGATPKLSKQRLVATLAATTDAQPQYALEGSIFIAGAAIQWLRDGLKFFQSAADVEELARKADKSQGVILVPALVGIGAPHWSPEARGTLFGLTRGTTTAEISLAALEGVACQVVDLMDAALKDCAGEDFVTKAPPLRVDGGMVRNNYFLQLQADLLGRSVIRSEQTEATSLGAAMLAGLKIGYWPDTNALRKLSKGERQFDATLSAADRQPLIERWRMAVQTTLNHYQSSA